jgi:hypothetical protein
MEGKDMLRIFVDEVPKDIKMEIVNNVEEQFAKIAVHGTDLDRKLIKEIEQGKYNDEQSFIDRFGFKLYNSELSTGCKAALCVANTSDKVINLQECGLNARDEIIRYCTTGNILIDENAITISNFEKSDSIDVHIDNYNITSISRLNKYIFSERPFEPDMSLEGIKCLN